MAWLAEYDPDLDAVHVTPIDDAVDHDTNTADPDCLCGPTTEPVKRDDGTIGWVLTHHSLDGRENHE